MIADESGFVNLGLPDNIQIGIAFSAQPDSVYPSRLGMGGHHFGKLSFQAISSTMLSSRSDAPLAKVNAY